MGIIKVVERDIVERDIVERDIQGINAF